MSVMVFTPLMTTNSAEESVNLVLKRSSKNLTFPSAATTSQACIRAIAIIAPVIGGQLMFNSSNHNLVIYT
jgi:hypothetical protein